MKKIVALVIALALACTLFGVLSFAEDAPAVDSKLVYNCTTGNNINGDLYLDTNKGESIIAVFNVSDVFNEIKLDVFWASNPSQGCGTANYNVKVDIYKFAYNVENTLKGTPIATAKLEDCAGDNYNSVPSFSAQGTNLTLSGENNGLRMILGEDAPAGQYVLVITNDAGEGSYVVLPTAEGDLSDVDFYRGTEEAVAFRFAVNTNGGFAAVVADSEVPTDAPQTGDMTVAMFSVVAVLALAAVVVLKKRVNA